MEDSGTQPRAVPAAPPPAAKSAVQLMWRKMIRVLVGRAVDQRHIVGVLKVQVKPHPVEERLLTCRRLEEAA